MTSEYEMRAADRDRERAMEVLCDAHAAGRLDLTEFHERTGAACSARTWGDLRDLTADLPEAQVLIRGGLDAGYHDSLGGKGNVGGNAGAVRRPFLPMVPMAVIWLSIAAVWHVAAAIPLVLLSMFLLAAACWKTTPSWQPDARTRQLEAQAMPPARPSGSVRRDVAVPAGRDVKARVATRYCSRATRRRGRCRRRR